MKILKSIAFILIIFTFYQCQSGQIEKEKTVEKQIEKEANYEFDKTAFPTAQAITKNSKTAFVPTLESPLNTQKNGIYGASLLLAWDEIRKELNAPITNIDNEMLQQINASESYKNVLKSSEYSTDVKVDKINKIIEAKVEFGITLPFPQPFGRQEDQLKFLRETVPSFGFSGLQENAGLYHYRNDDDFSLVLLPKNDEHSIILLKCDLDSIKTFNLNIC